MDGSQSWVNPQQVQLLPSQQSSSQLQRYILSPQNFGIQDYLNSCEAGDIILLTNKLKVGLMHVRSNKKHANDVYMEMFISGLRKDRRFSDATVLKQGRSKVFNQHFQMEMMNYQKSLLVAHMWERNKGGDILVAVCAINIGRTDLPIDSPSTVQAPLYAIHNEEADVQKQIGVATFRLTALNFSNNLKTKSSHQHFGSEGFVSTTTNKYNVRSSLSLLTTIITQADDLRFDRVFGFMFAEDYMAHAKTGDCFLHSGNTTASSVIQIATESIWSHVGMILVDPPDRVRTLYKLDSSQRVFVLDSDLATVDERTDGGVQIVDITTFVYKYFKDWEPNNLSAIRQLNFINQKAKITVSEYPGLERWLIQIYNAKYQQRFLEMVAAVQRLNTQSTEQSLFCSELLGFNYRTMGILPHDYVVSNLMPADFGPDRATLNKFFQQSSLVLGPPVRIRSKAFDVETKRLGRVVDNPSSNCCSVQ